MIFDFTAEIAVFAHPMGVVWNWVDINNFFLWDIGSTTNTFYKITNGGFANISGHVRAHGGGGTQRVLYDTSTGRFQGFKNGTLAQDHTIAAHAGGVGYGLQTASSGRRWEYLRTTVNVEQDEFNRPDEILGPPWTIFGAGIWSIVNGQVTATEPGYAILGLEIPVGGWMVGAVGWGGKTLAEA